MTGQAAGNFFLQSMYENFYQGKIFQNMNSFFLRSVALGSPHLPSLAFNSFSGSGTGPQCTSAVSWCGAASAACLYICLWIVPATSSLFNYILYDYSSLIFSPKDTFFVFQNLHRCNWNFEYSEWNSKSASSPRKISLLFPVNSYLSLLSQQLSVRQ